MLTVLLSILCSITTCYGMGHKVNLDKAIDDAISRYGIRTEPRLKTYFTNAHVHYPPREIALLAFKKEKHLQLWAQDEKRVWRHIYTYPLTASSGRLGPKLRERDLQIPEGIYRLTAFNPFSSMHLSLMINYPNQFDKIKASQDGRQKLGGDIFLHGKSLSVGCLAVGDYAIDQLFLLTRRVGLSHVQLIIAPNDLRVAQPATNRIGQPRWLPELYSQLTSRLRQFPIGKPIAKGASRARLAVNKLHTFW